MSARKPYEQRERRYVVDYVRTRYPDSYVIYQPKLGSIPEKYMGVDLSGLSSNIFDVTKRYADALVSLPDRNVLIEAKILFKIGAIAQLRHYATLIPQTEIPGIDTSKRLELQIVTVSVDAQDAAYASTEGVAVVVYQPQYAVEYLSSLLK